MSLAWQEISRFGKKAVMSGLTSSRFGNISLLVGEKIFITCTGSMLDELDQNQVIEVDLRGPCPQDRIASSETHFGTDELARAASLALRNHKACIARGHGVFAAGQNLKEAYTAACMAEHSAQVRYLVKAYRAGPDFEIIG